MKKIFTRLIPRLYGAYFNLLALFSKKKAAEAAFTVFCTPRKGKVLPLQRDFLNEISNPIKNPPVIIPNNDTTNIIIVGDIVFSTPNKKKVIKLHCA